MHDSSLWAQAIYCFTATRFSFYIIEKVSVIICQLTSMSCDWIFLLKRRLYRILTGDFEKFMRQMLCKKLYNVFKEGLLQVYEEDHYS